MGLKVSNSEILVTVLLSTLYEKGLSTSTGNLVKIVAISFFASCIKTNDPSPKPKKLPKLEIVFTKRPSLQNAHHSRITEAERGIFFLLSTYRLPKQNSFVYLQIRHQTECSDLLWVPSQ